MATFVGLFNEENKTEKLATCRDSLESQQEKGHHHPNYLPQNLPNWLLRRHEEGMQQKFGVEVKKLFETGS